MGRRRKIRMNDIHIHYVRCACGEEVEVFDKAVNEVKCCYCAMGMRPIPDNYHDDIDKFMAEEKQNASIKKKRGRPCKNVNVETNSATTLVAPKKRGRGRPKKEKVMDEIKNEVSVETGVENAVTETKVKKVSKKNDKKVSNGKRGRKATVGAKVLSFINEKKTNVKFEDILNIYSAEREVHGKKASPEIEKRNCLSTLYILKRDSRILEIKPKEIYSAMN